MADDEVEAPAPADVSATPQSDIALWKSQVGESFGTLPKEVILRIFKHAVVPGDEITVTIESEASAAGKIVKNEPVEPMEKRVYVEKTIKPVQVCQKANKFFWGAKLSTEEKLAAPALMATCKAFYTIMNESAVFYQQNEFEFADTRNMLRYLASITPPRLQDLRNIVFTLDHLPLLDDICTLLSTCTQLENVTLRILNYNGVSYSGIGIPASKCRSALSKVRCKIFRVSVPTLAFYLPQPLTAAAKEEKRLTYETTLSALYNHLTKGPPVKANDHALYKARLASGIYIHGNGRLNGEAKPGLVSSRTRGGIARQSMVNSNGIVEYVEKKFNTEGSLIWDIRLVTEHKEISDPETSQKGFTLLVRWQKPISERFGAKCDHSWELLEVLLTNPDNYSELYFYFNARNGGKLWETTDVAKIIHDAVIENGNRPVKGAWSVGGWYMSKLADKIRKRKEYLALEAEPAAEHEAEAEAVKAETAAEHEADAEAGAEADEAPAAKQKKPLGFAQQMDGIVISCGGSTRSRPFAGQKRKRKN